MKVGETIQVSPYFHHLALEVQNASGAVAHAAATGTKEDIEALWPRLCAAREALYRYVEAAEEELNVDRPTVLRF